MKAFKTTFDGEFATKLAIALITWAAIVIAVMGE